WDDGEDGEGSRHAYRRRQQEDELVRACRNNVFLEEELDGVGNGLKQAPRPDPHGAQPRLHEREDFALHVDEVSHNPGDHRKHNQDLDGRQDEWMESEKVNCVLGHSLYRNSKIARHTSDLEFRISHYRSTSPSTISSVPITATTSATRWPRIMMSRACKFKRDGGRTRTR